MHFASLTLHVRVANQNNTRVSIVLSRYSIFLPVVYVLLVVENDCLSHFSLREISHIVVSSVLFSYFRAEISCYQCVNQFIFN